MRAAVVGASDPERGREQVSWLVRESAGGGGLGDSPVGGHDQHRGHVGLQCTVQEREALNVQHVHFINKQHLQNEHTPGLLLCNHVGKS